MESNQKKQRGLYVLEAESDACGVGIIANIKNKASYKIVESAMTMLENMEHRGARGFEVNTGDGAGILTQLPHVFFKYKLEQQGVIIPEQGKYGVGMFFFPKSIISSKEKCYHVINQVAGELGFQAVHKRIIPVDNTMLGDSALKSEPEMEQWFFQPKKPTIKDKELENAFYVLRATILNRVEEIYPVLKDDFYISSLSSKTIVYKGLLTATQLRSYFIDLQDKDYMSAVALVHSRFSTNTLPEWKLAQPFRIIAHNGEINTLRGNINWWEAEEKHLLLHTEHGEKLKCITPICDPAISDSGNFDNVVDFITHTSGRSIPHVMMMMIPEAWQNNKGMLSHKKAFYQYHENIMEPWEGPASICFTDGTLVGATLDRNGLRPSRYVLTSDDTLILGSEAGCIPVDPEKIILKGRLEPGKILIADLEQHRLITDEELKNTICQRKPYRDWIEEHVIYLNDIKTIEEELPSLDDTSLKQHQVAFGYSQEDEKLVLNAMYKEGKEPIGSMGLDIPLAVLSKKNQHISNYFKQQFAQVTNPPIDSYREQYYMSLFTTIGGVGNIMDQEESQSKAIYCPSPIIDEKVLNNILHIDQSGYTTHRIDTTYHKGQLISNVIHKICKKAVEKVIDGKRFICISNRHIDKQKVPVPSLLITGALHHELIRKGLRKQTTIIVDAGDAWETHHVAILLSYGADLICPYMAIQSVKSLANQSEVNEEKAVLNYLKTLEKGVLKIMSKIGIATLSSYKGAQTFEAVGISDKVIAKCFKGTVSRIGGMRFKDIEKENDLKHIKAYGNDHVEMENAGVFQWRKTGEYHMFNPTTIHLLQHSTNINDYSVYKEFASAIDKVEENASTLRSYFDIRTGNAISIDEVDSREEILKRFVTGAMSFGSISKEAHTTLAIAMNRIGAKSNTGEGGEDPERNKVSANGDTMRSAIKQVASGRFGVDMTYLSNADEIQIKLAQGAKPGEGGQLPGHKVDGNIAKVRNSTPGVGLISPPPHHDIYSIEDLAQLIFDLKNANESARISVKLVAKSGVGVIASGVTKAHAEHILISGHDGGTGASPLSSIRHAGLPWEMGLSETHQTLIKNGLRDKVVLQTDGQIRTGRDMAIATMLGAEEWGISTAALVVEGCILMRKCHLNTCPVGIATQDKALRKKFAGKVEQLVNYFYFLADNMREIMASVGVRTVNELVGRTDLIKVRNIEKHWKTQNLDLRPILFQEINQYNVDNYATKDQDHEISKVLDRQLILMTKGAIHRKESFEANFNIKNTDRAVGTMLSNYIYNQCGESYLVTDSIKLKFEGSAGQSFGAFGVKGLSLHINGESNDYYGKGLCGATLSINPHPSTNYESEKNIIIGNVALYGATSGYAYINGMAGDRFCVRNSGAIAVVEGVGDNGCEYMTGGRVVILGGIGRNFAAGMSGGIAYLYNHQTANNHLLNKEMISIEYPSKEDILDVKSMIECHHQFTKSNQAEQILNNWKFASLNFIKIIPHEYKKALELLSTSIDLQ